MPDKPNKGKDEPRQEDPTEEKKPRPSHVPAKHLTEKSDGKMSGFYPVLNEIHDKAVKELSLAECALFEHLWRKLIGWGNFQDEISISQLVEETSACRATIINLTKKLEEKRWIVITRQSSVTDRKFTSKIAIPACPGIKSRLGWSKNQTRGSLESIPGGSLKSRPTTDILFKNSLKKGGKEQQTTGNIVTTGMQESCHSSEDVVVFPSNSLKESEIGKLVEALCEFENVEEAEARSLIQELIKKHGADAVEKQIGTALEQKETIRNVGGWLRKAVKSNYKTAKDTAENHPYIVAEPKSQEQIEADAKELRKGASVSPDKAQELATRYKSHFLRRHIAQLKRDNQQDKCSGNYEKIICSRIEHAKEPPDYPGYDDPEFTHQQGEEMEAGQESIEAPARRQELIKMLNSVYHAHKDGEMPPDEKEQIRHTTYRYEDAVIPFLRQKIEDVQELKDDLEFTPDEWQAAIDRWHTRAK